MKKLGLTISAILSVLFFYAYVSVLVISPDVTDAYYEFYISHEADEIPFQIATLPPFKIGMTVDFRSEHLGYDGWSIPEDNFRWSAGKRASLLFFLEDSIKLDDIDKITLEFQTLGQQRVLFFLNEQMQLDTEISSSRIVEIDVPVSLGVARSGINRLDVDLPNARAPGNGDSRELGVAIHSFTLN